MVTYIKGRDFEENTTEIMHKLNAWDIIALILVIIGGLNWGLVGIADANVVSAIFGSIARLIYILVGIAAIYLIWLWTKIEKR